MGGLTSCAAIAFAAYHVGAPPAELPAEPLAAAPANTLTVEGKCADAQTRVVGKGGNVFHLILPPGCALKP
ncbi:hypothetical protein APY03_3182 [Variovorax sp. WDL1]|nr:hypothetical protein APY03_3182 [Variovorax sp. WDL1]